MNGLNGSIFGQVAFCNGTQFFQAANRAEAQGTLNVPALGTSASKGTPCPSTRSFEMIDQDQSDNVTSTYLLTGNGQTAQDNGANEATRLAGAQKINNGSDNLLLDAFLDPVMGCTPMEAPDLSNAGAMGTSQALDELQATKDATAPIALVPENDEMVLVDNNFSATKTNLYRMNVGQPPISNANNQVNSPANYCQNMVNVQTPFLAKNQTSLTGWPDPGTRDREQPVHVHGQPAEHVLHQPQLPELRPDQPGHGHPGRQRRGDRGHVQHHPADRRQPGRQGDAGAWPADGPSPAQPDEPVRNVEIAAVAPDRA